MTSLIYYRYFIRIYMKIIYYISLGLLADSNDVLRLLGCVAELESMYLSVESTIPLGKTQENKIVYGYYRRNMLVYTHRNLPRKPVIDIKLLFFGKGCNMKEPPKTFEFFPKKAFGIDLCSPWGNLYP